MEPTTPPRTPQRPILPLILIPLATVLAAAAIAAAIAVAVVSIVHLYNVENDLRDDIAVLERRVEALEAVVERNDTLPGDAEAGFKLLGDALDHLQGYSEEAFVNIGERLHDLESEVFRSEPAVTPAEPAE